MTHWRMSRRRFFFFHPFCHLLNNHLCLLSDIRIKINTLQYSCLENPMDGGAWWAAVHGVAKSQTRLRDFTFHFHALEKEMATHSSVLAWRIPGMGEPGGLPSMGLHRVGHDWNDLAAAAAAACLIITKQVFIYLVLWFNFHNSMRLTKKQIYHDINKS